MKSEDNGEAKPTAVADIFISGSKKMNLYWLGPLDLDGLFTGPDKDDGYKQLTYPREYGEDEINYKNIEYHDVSQARK